MLLFKYVCHNPQEMQSSFLRNYRASAFQLENLHSVTPKNLILSNCRMFFFNYGLFRTCDKYVHKPQHFVQVISVYTYDVQIVRIFSRFVIENIT